MYARASTRIVVGLGNPGQQYARTRHNAGWMVIDEIAHRASAPAAKKRFHAEISEAQYHGVRLVLVKPQTYMNESGRAVREILSWYKASPQDCLLVVDDLDIPFGRLRLRPDGSAGGHNGLKSIFADTGTTAFPRLRIGIGRPQHARAQAIGHVLSAFSKDEQPYLATVIDAASNTIDMWLNEGLLATMNATNGVPSVISDEGPA
jgi:PTH1 family peptidyl-tRNA hydrolase